MSTHADMLECEKRNEGGYPRVGIPTTRPIAKVRTGHAPSTTKIEQNTDNSNNKPLPWVALGCALGGMGFAASLILAVLGPQYVRSESRSAQAELRAEFAQQIADARAEAKMAGTDAAIWKNRVVGLEKTLEAQSNVRR